MLPSGTSDHLGLDEREPGPGMRGNERGISGDWIRGLELPRDAQEEARYGGFSSAEYTKPPASSISPHCLICFGVEGFKARRGPGEEDGDKIIMIKYEIERVTKCTYD